MFNKMFANCILVDNFKKSLDFYQNKLGLKLNTRDGNFANFKINNIELAIMQKSQAVEILPLKFMNKGGGVLLCFQVPDVDKACKELSIKGVDIIAGPKQTSWGQTVAYFQDPDHHIWEISEL